MDLFFLDKVVVDLFQRLMTDPAFQFGILAGIGLLVNAIFPDSKNNKENKK